MTDKRIKVPKRRRLFEFGSVRSYFISGRVGEGCPACGSPEVDAMNPSTVYACGSSDYDGRPDTFLQKCRGDEE